MERTSLQMFITQRMAVLLKEEADVSGHLREIRAEKERLRKAAAAAGVEIESAGSQSSLFEKRPPKRLKDKTLKEAVLEILADFPDGLAALDILQKINSKSGVAFSRASLSPQLSRLKQEERILAKNGIWILYQKSHDVDLEQREPRQTEGEVKRGDQ